MSLTIGLAGMDPATEAALKAALQEANERLAGRWELLPETQADHIVVDMDSMYGPMSWLRLHASGKHVIGLTSAARTQTDFRLGRPFNIDSLVALLREIDGGAATAVEAATPSTRAAAPVQPEPAATVEPAVPVPAVPAAVVHAEAAPEPPVAAPGPAPEVAPVAEAAAPPPAPTPRPEPQPAPGAATPTRLFDWLSSAQLGGRQRYRRPSGPTLLLDLDARQYHGPSALKPLMQYFEGEVARADFDTPDAATWNQEAAVAGDAQPLTRLLWLGALVSGKGQLLPGHDPDAKYQLNRWPQTEREFPRHFRIATAMMKGPATLADVAGASGIALDEVTDFVNANLATGAASVAVDPPPEPAPAPKAGGLLGRLRGR